MDPSTYCRAALKSSSTLEYNTNMHFRILDMDSNTYRRSTLETVVVVVVVVAIAKVIVIVIVKVIVIVM